MYNIIATFDPLSKFPKDSGVFCYGSLRYACAFGQEGVTLTKKEGDLKTPLGIFPLRDIYYRADRLTLPSARGGLKPLVAKPLTPHDGWCDDVSSPLYNQHIIITPHTTCRHEMLWRDDALYDIIIVLGFNDEPIVPGAGSAVFLHVARASADGVHLEPTKGCLALHKEDMLEFLAHVQQGAFVDINTKDTQ